MFSSASGLEHGDACSLMPIEPCPCQLPEDFAKGTLRLSTGRHTTMEDVAQAADLIIREAKRQLGCDG